MQRLPVHSVPEMCHLRQNRLVAALKAAANMVSILALVPELPPLDLVKGSGAGSRYSRQHRRRQEPCSDLSRRQGKTKLVEILEEAGARSGARFRATEI